MACAHLGRVDIRHQQYPPPPPPHLPSARLWSTRHLLMGPDEGLRARCATEEYVHFGVQTDGSCTEGEAGTAVPQACNRLRMSSLCSLGCADTDLGRGVRPLPPPPGCGSLEMLQAGRACELDIVHFRASFFRYHNTQRNWRNPSFSPPPPPPHHLRPPPPPHRLSQLHDL